jgi:glycosyltransferase involved in cell wall biosynthesis
MVIFLTRVYNGEKTLPRAIESILNQMGGDDFRYLIFDNGSIDSTFDIIKRYQSLDSRIILLRAQFNELGFQSLLPSFEYVANNYSADDYLCVLDADDRYKEDFMSEMETFAQNNSLDFACCGYDAIERGSGRLIEVKKLEEDLVMSHDELPRNYLSYRRYTTDLWAKLFRVRCLQSFIDLNRVNYFAHEILSQQCLVYFVMRNAFKTGFLSKSLMEYTVSNAQQSIQRTYGQLHFKMYEAIYTVANNFLSSFGETLPENTSYVYAFYFDYIRDYFHSLKINNTVSDSNKVNLTRNVFDNNNTRNLFKHAAAEKWRNLTCESKKGLCDEILGMLYSLGNYDQEKERIDYIKGVMTQCGVKVE